MSNTDPHEAELERSYRASLILHVVFLAAPLAYVAVIYALASNDMLPRYRAGETMRWLIPTLLGVLSVALIVTRGAQASLKRGQSVAEALAAAHVMRSSINETIAVFGLLVYMLNADAWQSVPFIAIGFLALVRERPNKTEWRRAVTKGRL
jgi:ABC-type sugar transport system permease subunit